MDEVHVITDIDIKEITFTENASYLIKGIKITVDVPTDMGSAFSRLSECGEADWEAAFLKYPEESLKIKLSKFINSAVRYFESDQDLLLVEAPVARRLDDIGDLG